MIRVNRRQLLKAGTGAALALKSGFRTSGEGVLAVSYPEQTRNSRTELIYDIPGLEPLRTTNVEGLPQVRPGQNIPLTNAEWFAWYPQVLLHINAVRRSTEAKSSYQSSLRNEQIRLIAADERYWFYTFATIFESRVEEEGTVYESEEATASYSASGISPFILYPFQDYWITWHNLALRTRGGKGDTLTIKSRDMGATNTAVGSMAYRWMTRRVYHGRLLSRKEELVDASGDPDAMFWKLDTMLRSTPRWVLDYYVPGFDWMVHRREMTLEHPTRFNLLKGESTNATAGRGKRAFDILMDEFTFMQKLRAIMTATRPAAPHRTLIGSVSTSQGLDAYTLATSGRPAVIYLDSRTGMHPRQDENWHKLERERDTEAGYAQEVGMDWFADSSDFVYPEASRKKVGDYPYRPFAGPVFAAIDDGFHWAIWWIQYCRDTGRFHVLDFYRNQGKRTAFYGGIMRGMAVDGFDYGPNEHAILKLAREIPVNTFVGDTHGAHFEQTAGMSAIQDLALNWGIQVNVDYEQREYRDRQKALADLLPHMDFNDTPRVAMGLLNLQMYRFKATPPGQEVAREVREPLHNDDSHGTTALEYFATNFEAFKFVYAGLHWSQEPVWNQ